MKRSTDYFSPTVISEWQFRNEERFPLIPRDKQYVVGNDETGNPVSTVTENEIALAKKILERTPPNENKKIYTYDYINYPLIGVLPFAFIRHQGEIYADDTKLRLSLKRKHGVKRPDISEEQWKNVWDFAEKRFADDPQLVCLPCKAYKDDVLRHPVFKIGTTIFFLSGSGFTLATGTFSRMKAATTEERKFFAIKLFKRELLEHYRKKSEEYFFKETEFSYIFGLFLYPSFLTINGIHNEKLLNVMKLYSSDLYDYLFGLRKARLSSSNDAQQQAQFTEGLRSNIVFIFTTFAKALLELHEKHRTLHRDIKLENVLLRITGGKITELRLCDFGAIVPIPADGIYRSEEKAGTPQTWAPELKQQLKAYSRASDIYALLQQLIRCAETVLGMERFTLGAQIYALGKHCAQEKPEDRPSLAQLIQWLAVINTPSPQHPEKVAELLQMQAKNKNCSATLLLDFFNRHADNPVHQAAKTFEHLFWLLYVFEKYNASLLSPSAHKTATTFERLLQLICLFTQYNHYFSSLKATSKAFALVVNKCDKNYGMDGYLSKLGLLRGLCAVREQYAPCFSQSPSANLPRK